MGRGRVEAFSDGVFAVAVTLLALDLAVGGRGHGTLLHQLGHEWPSYAAYVVSFFTIGVIWVNHHALFATFTRIDRALLFWNLLLLMFVVAIPFATSTLAEYLTAPGTDGHVAAALYGVVMIGMGISFRLILWWAIGHHLTARPMEPAERKAALRRFGAGLFAYVGATALAFVDAYLTLAICGAVAIYYVFEQTPGPEPASDTGGTA